MQCCNCATCKQAIRDDNEKALRSLFFLFPFFLNTNFHSALLVEKRMNTWLLICNRQAGSHCVQESPAVLFSNGSIINSGKEANELRKKKSTRQQICKTKLLKSPGATYVSITKFVSYINEGKQSNKRNFSGISCIIPQQEKNQNEKFMREYTRHLKLQNMRSF